MDSNSTSYDRAEDVYAGGEGREGVGYYAACSWFLRFRFWMKNGFPGLNHPRTGPRRDWYFIAKQPALAPHLALRIALVTVPRVSRSCERFPDGFDLHLLQDRGRVRGGRGKEGGGRLKRWRPVDERERVHGNPLPR